MPDRPANRLARSTSPYLLQHAANPVDWWEWGSEAFAESRRRDRPILLSVGYAACHWCHVMAHESFEDPATAAEMNERFVNIKVDREERPDVDRIYMDAVQAATGRGGWPMTVFLTPDGRPFAAGTYFPAEDRGGLPGFRRVLEAVSDAWEHRRDEVLQQAGRLAAVVGVAPPPDDDLPGHDDLVAAYRAVDAAYDPEHGGFGGAPKFPQAPTLEFLLRIAGEAWAPRASAILEHTLTAMADGGIYDHLGGGFARYSVDRRWRVPHFEKMLYDNALLARLYLRAGQVTGNARFTIVARETLDYMLTDLRLPGGGFASAEDADSEGREGAFYVFTADEVAAAAGDDAPAAIAAFGITAEGDLEGANVLHRAATDAEVSARLGTTAAEASASIARSRAALRSARAQRIRPAVDDKAVAAWNALAIRAFAEAGAVLGDTRYLDAAREAAAFLLEELHDDRGRLQRAWREGRRSGPGFADDQAAAAAAYLALHQATGDPQWFGRAEAAAAALTDLFWDGEGGGVFATGTDGEDLIARPKNLFDNPVPSENSLAAEVFATLASATGDPAHLARVDSIARSAGAALRRAPSGVGHLLAVLATVARRQELAVVGDPGDPRTGALLAVAGERFRPGLFVAVGPASDPDPAVPLLAGRPAGPGGEPLAYVCRDFVCAAPTGDPTTLRTLLT